MNQKFLFSPTQKRRARAMRKAKRDHRALIAMLGNKCKECENTWDDCPLQIHHPDGRENANHSEENRGKRWDVRVKAYWKEYNAGVKLEVLCIICNSRDGRERQLKSEDLEEAPF